MADPIRVPDLTRAETLGPDRTRQTYPTDARFWIVSASWAQRAVNAAHALSGASSIFVDGRAGPITIAALRELGPGLPPAENYPTTQRVSDRVLIARSLASMLEGYAPAGDPARPQRVAVTTVASSDVPQAAAVDASGASDVLLELHAAQPWWPRLLAAAGGALVGLGGAYMIWRK